MAKPTILAVDDDVQVPERARTQSPAQVWQRSPRRASCLRRRRPGCAPSTQAPQRAGRPSAQRSREGLVAAQAAHPERFVRGVPRVPDMPSAVWINPPHAKDDTRTAGPSSGYGSSQMPSLKLP